MDARQKNDTAIRFAADLERLGFRKATVEDFTTYDKKRKTGMVFYALSYYYPHLERHVLSNRTDTEKMREWIKDGHLFLEEPSTERYKGARVINLENGDITPLETEEPERGAD